MRELAMIGLLLIAQAAIAAETPRATVVDFVQPVLIRHENSPLLRVEVEAPQVPSVRVTSFVFSLEGTSDLRELESIRLFATGEKTAFHSKTALPATARSPVGSGGIGIGKAMRIVQDEQPLRELEQLLS